MGCHGADNCAMYSRPRTLEQLLDEFITSNLESTSEQGLHFSYPSVSSRLSWNRTQFSYQPPKKKP
jgi:hypothetical protein